jgi:small-conductance mechanosensitive channel
LKSRVRNFGRAMERHAIFSIHVPYETPVEKLALIPKLITEAVAAEPRARLDRCHLRQFGDSALIYEISLCSLAPTFDALVERQHSINLAIIDAFARNGIDFAYPTRRVLTRAT